LAGGCTVIFEASESGIEDYHVLLRTEDGNGAVYFGCSDAVELGVWNHVAVSFDPNGTTLLVNGELAANARAVVPAASVLRQHTCGEGANFPLNFSDNERDFLWGASNIGAPDNEARDGTTGLLDELRFRTARINEIQASSVYDSLDGPGHVPGVCGFRLGSRIGLYRVDSDESQVELLDEDSSDIPEASQAVEKNGSTGELEPVPLNTRSREAVECGLAVELGGVSSGTFVRIRNTKFRNMDSVDFWFNTEKIDNAGGVGGLLVADGDGNEKADMGVYIFRSDPKQ
jgi:hypothetical protein